LKRLVFITQQVDPEHPALGATVAKIAALAGRLDEVAVLADGAVAGALPENCRVRTFAAGSRAGRGLRFERALALELRRPRPLAVVAHMCPIYAVLAAPLARPLRIPVLLWYAHWNPSPTLRLAERLATRIVTTDRRTFPLASGKVVPVGQAIDVERFTCRERQPGAKLEAIALGRYSPAKGYRQLLEAVAQVENARLRVYGPTLTEEERNHKQKLHDFVKELQLTQRVQLNDAVARERIPDLLSEADVLLNNMRGGTSDKVVYEAGASCVPVIASNPVFDDLLSEEWRFAREDVDELAQRLRTFSQLAPDERARLGRALRERVLACHSVDSWADGILAAARS
jgi:glycosyltransferase involved in cell wall biosynthesis